MAIDFESEGLLDGLEGQAREDRLELLQELAGDGVPLDELRHAVEEDRLALLPVERFLEGGGGDYTIKEVAEKAGVDPELLIQLRGALGLVPPDPDAKAATEEDVEAAKRMRTLLDAGLPEEGLLENSRVMGIAMSQVAASNNALVGDAMLEPGDTELEAARRYVAAAQGLTPLLGPALEYALKLHLREQLRQAAVGSAQLAEGSLAGSQEVTACFADLVDFTRLGQSMDFAQLAALTTRLGELAREVSRPPVRLVKMIGDAAMLISPENDALLEAALDLVDAAATEGEGFPALRAGLARGEAIGRGGDWYGHPVNLASRITDFAFPASVLCDEAVHDAAGDGFRFTFAGAHRLKGIEKPVKLHRVRRAESSA
ncbi:MAG: adenylate cyclase [Solirubrobacterales bacterium]|jgi:adenylate cyclase|nr:adenylate cyclase [Solirubrobacterales bacterium]